MEGRIASTEHDAPPDPGRKARIDGLLDWMIDGARPSASAREIIRGICDGLVEAGVPIDRFALFIFTLHPNLQGRRFRWYSGGDVDMAEAEMGLFTGEIYTHNPLPHVIETRKSLRRHLEDPACPEDYIIVRELREQGQTDYLACPLIYTTGETHSCSFSTTKKGGFSDDDLAVLHRICPPLARLTETYMLRLNAITLLSAYVGRDGGQRILEGQVHRGDGEEISAVILFADLKDFTTLSNRLQGRELVELLNDTFDLMVPPIVAAGGEILKFMGDGILAIFPYDSNQEVPEVCLRAMDAVLEGTRAVEGAGSDVTMSFRAALHHGIFHYGNIGGGDRLDFTAIGPPINYAARLLAGGSELNCDRVISADLAERTGQRCEPLGNLTLKGFDGVQQVWKF